MLCMWRPMSPYPLKMIYVIDFIIMDNLTTRASFSTALTSARVPKLEIEKHLSYIQHQSMLEKAMMPGNMSTAGYLKVDDSLFDIIIRDAETVAKLNITHQQIADWMDNIVLAYTLLKNGLTCGSQEVTVFGRKYIVKLIVWRGGQTCPYDILREPELKSKADLQSELDYQNNWKSQCVKLFPLSNLAIDNTPDICGKYLKEAIDNYDELISNGGATRCTIMHKSTAKCGYGWYDVTVTFKDTQESINFSSLMPHLIRDYQFFESGPYRVDPEELIKYADLKPYVSYELPPLQHKKVWFPRGSDGHGPNYTIRENEIIIDLKVFPPSAHVEKAVIHKYDIITEKEVLYILFNSDPHDDFEFDGHVLHKKSVYSGWSPRWFSFTRGIHEYRGESGEATREGSKGNRRCPLLCIQI